LVEPKDDNDSSEEEMIKKDVLDDSDTFERKSNDGRAESEFEFKKANNSDLKGDISAF
jgi:hypothetical protein